MVSDLINLRIIMLRILIPTDFSLFAHRAAEYAVRLAENLDADFTLLHVNAVPCPSYAFLPKVDELIESQAQKALHELAQSLMKSTGYEGRIHTACLNGQAVGGIGDYAREHRTDLIIMGTKGESVIKNRIFGSVASGVLEHVHCPALFVPVDVPPEKPTHIAFATDLTDLDLELPELIAFARFFNATIHVLPVYPDTIRPDTFDEERTKLELMAQNDYPKITFTAVMDTDIISGIDRFIQSDAPDMLAMFTYKSGVLSFLFDTSYTEEMTFHSHVPLLVMRKHFEEGD